MASTGLVLEMRYTSLALGMRYASLFLGMKCTSLVLGMRYTSLVLGMRYASYDVRSVGLYLELRVLLVRKNGRGVMSRQRIIVYRIN